MTRKDYELLASALEGMPAFAPTLRAGRESAARAIAEALEADNPRFDHARFLEACGISA